MIGRVVHYRDRRILIFCGERSHDLHPVYGIVDTGAAVGEEAEARTYQSNKFHETESAVALGASNEGHITSAAKLPDIGSGLSLRQSVDAAAYVNVYASVSGGILTDNSVDTMKTSSVFSEADSGIAESEDIEAIKTSVARLAESDEVIAVGGNSKGFATSHHNEAEAESVIAAGEDNEASITYYEIKAGKYESRDNISEFDEFNIIIPIEISVIDEITYDYVIKNLVNFACEYDGLWYILSGETSQSETIVFGDNVYPSDAFSLTTEDGTFTVLQDTIVASSQYTIFNRYFQLASDN